MIGLTVGSLVVVLQSVFTFLAWDPKSKIPLKGYCILVVLVSFGALYAGYDAYTSERDSKALLRSMNAQLETVRSKLVATATELRRDHAFTHEELARIADQLDGLAGDLEVERITGASPDEAARLRARLDAKDAALTELVRQRDTFEQSLRQLTEQTDPATRNAALRTILNDVLDDASIPVAVGPEAQRLMQKIETLEGLDFSALDKLTTDTITDLKTIDFSKLANLAVLDDLQIDKDTLAGLAALDDFDAKRFEGLDKLDAPPDAVVNAVKALNSLDTTKVDAFQAIGVPDQKLVDALGSASKLDKAALEAFGGLDKPDDPVLEAVKTVATLDTAAMTQFGKLEEPKKDVRTAVDAATKLDLETLKVFDALKTPERPLVTALVAAAQLDALALGEFGKLKAAPKGVPEALAALNALELTKLQLLLQLVADPAALDNLEKLLAADGDVLHAVLMRGASRPDYWNDRKEGADPVKAVLTALRRDDAGRAVVSASDEEEVRRFLRALDRVGSGYKKANP